MAIKLKPTPKITEDQRANFYYELSALLEHGISPRVAMESLYAQASKRGKVNNNYTRFLSEVLLVMKNGGKMNEALNKWVPLADRMTIAAGESSGDLASPLLGLSQNIELTKEMKSVLRGAIIGPVWQLLTMLGFLYIIGTIVIPKMTALVPAEYWTNPLSNSLIVVTGFVESYLLAIVVFLFVILMWIGWSFENLTSKIRIKLDKMPPWSIYRMYIGSRVLKAIGMLISAGVPPQKALVMVSQNSSPWLAQRINAASFNMRNGMNMGEAFQAAGHNFPDTAIINNLVIFSSLSKMHNHVDTVADIWLKNGIKTIRQNAEYLAVALKLMMVIMVMWLGLSLFAVMGDMVTGVMSKAGF